MDAVAQAAIAIRADEDALTGKPKRMVEVVEDHETARVSSSSEVEEGTAAAQAAAAGTRVPPRFAPSLIEAPAAGLWLEHVNVERLLPTKTEL